MRKALIIYGVIIIIVFIIALLKFSNSISLPSFGGGNNSDAVVAVKNQEYDVTIVNTENERMVGLSETEKLGGNDGMLFLFPNKARHAFWMKGMAFPIDIVYIDGDTVVDVIKNAQPASDEMPVSQIRVYRPRADADRVLEINAGEADDHEIEPGDKVSFNNVKEKAE